MSDPAELEREAEAARARLSDTAERIRDRMTPGQLMDEVLGQFRGSDGSRMLANLQGQVRDNPMALALVGSGLAWLMMGSGGQTQGAAAPYVVRTPAAPYPAAEGGTSGAWREDTARTWGEDASRAGTEAGSAAGSGSGSGSSVAEMAQGASEAFSSARGAVGDGLEAAGVRAQRFAHDLRSAGSDAVGGVRHSATGVGHQARDTFLDVLEREPLVIGAIGVAVGAALGAFLPATEVERRHLGPTGEALKEKADALVDRGVAKAKEAAAEVYETARDEADRQGLLPGDAPVAGKIDAVVRAAGDTAGEIAGRTAPRAAPKAASPGAGSIAGSEIGTGTGTAGTGSDAGAPSGQPQPLRP
jgi:Protein of unknown function (DUF3618)